MPLGWLGRAGDSNMRYRGCLADGRCSGIPVLCFVPFSPFFPLPWEPGRLAAGPTVDVASAPLLHHESQQTLFNNPGAEKMRLCAASSLGGWGWWETKKWGRKRPSALQTP